jgi:hypothetical protein
MMRHLFTSLIHSDQSVAVVLRLKMTILDLTGVALLKNLGM